MKTIYLEQLGGIKRKFLGKIFPMLILEVTKKQGFTLSLSLSLSLFLSLSLSENYVFEKTIRGSN